jgi:hypothetical protein
LAIAKKEAISDLREATEQDVLILRRYVAERDPEKQLEYLRKILDELYVNLVSRFDIKDVLLKVGDPRVKELTDQKLFV